MFQKVTQKVWFVVLVGLLLGLACGAVMARWPSLRGVAAGVAVVGVLLLGRVTRRLTWFVVGVAPVVTVFAYAANRRWGFPVALVGSTLVAVASLVVGGIWGLWEAVRRRGGSGCSHACAVCALSSGDVKLSKQYHRSPGVMCPDTGQPCTKGCDATAKPCDRNGSVHPNSVPPIDENAQIERLARLLHDAGRSAVEPSGAFVEWDDAPERTRAGRRSQAQYLLAAGVVLPTGSALDRIAADVAELRRLAEPAKLTIPPSSVTVNASNPADAEAAKRFIFQTLADGLRKPVTVNGNAVCPLWRQLGNLCPCSRDGSLDHAVYCETGPGKNSQGWPVEAAPSADAEQIKRDCEQAAEKLKSDPKLADDAKAHLDIAAKMLADELIRRETLRKSPFYVADDEREVTLIAQRPKFSKAYFLARIGADACYRLPDGKLDVKTANRALYDAFKPLVEGELLPPVEHTPAPHHHQIAQQAADREAAAK